MTMVRTPLHEPITEFLREQVDRSNPGDLLPTIAELTAMFGVGGVQTIRNAYAPLIEEGLVERLDAPRRWAVVDRGQGPAPAEDIAARLDEVEDLLSRATEMVRALRRAC
ncbi:GntR family transcriptional regulator [Gordonia polyisoprenivorans]|uniref:GntR family transcriptional regulator n=1 Tax=Gordonia polyisoprenivorans TaxID=84595 RepID=UPI002233F066|nr:GntR family transcriptional regulator [Gordonia polyisoprenivorans]